MLSEQKEMACAERSRSVAGLGLEPRQTDSESVVLPLHHPAK